MKRYIRQSSASRRGVERFSVRGSLARRAHLAARLLNITPDEFAREALREYVERELARRTAA